MRIITSSLGESRHDEPDLSNGSIVSCEVSLLMAFVTIPDLDQVTGIGALGRVSCSIVSIRRCLDRNKTYQMSNQILDHCLAQAHLRNQREE